MSEAPPSDALSEDLDSQALPTPGQDGPGTEIWRLTRCDQPEQEALWIDSELLQDQEGGLMPPAGPRRVEPHCELELPPICEGTSHLFEGRGGGGAAELRIGVLTEHRLGVGRTACLSGLEAPVDPALGGARESGLAREARQVVLALRGRDSLTDLSLGGLGAPSDTSPLGPDQLPEQGELLGPSEGTDLLDPESDFGIIWHMPWSEDRQGARSIVDRFARLRSGPDEARKDERQPATAHRRPPCLHSTEERSRSLDQPSPSPPV